MILATLCGRLNMADEKVVDIGNLADQYRERIMRRDLLMAVLARIDVQLISPLMFGLERKDQREITAVKMMIGGEIAREEKKLSAVIEETIRQFRGAANVGNGNQ